MHKLVRKGPKPAVDESSFCAAIAIVTKYSQHDEALVSTKDVLKNIANLVYRYYQGYYDNSKN